MTELPRYSTGELMKYSDLGLYPLYYLDKQNSVLCQKCASKSDSDPDELADFKPVAVGVNYEDPRLFCDHCSERIESAYSEDEVDTGGDDETQTY